MRFRFQIAGVVVLLLLSIFAGLRFQPRSVSAASLATATVSLAPQDTYLTLDTKTHGTAPTLTAYTWPNNQVANNILMKFDLSSIPAAAVVSQATLYLSLVSADSSADTTYVMTANKITGRNPTISKATGYTADGTTTWTANSCCKNGIPMAEADISAPYDTVSIDKTNGSKTWNLTSMVREWLASPSTNFGVLLNADTQASRDRWRTFASVENGSVSIRPYLSVTYSSGDVTPPTVAITTPGAGATLSSVVSLTAAASDNVAVAGVQFKLNGTSIGAELTAYPYTLSWNTSTVSDGSYTLTAVARDAAGNTATSAGVAVTVANGLAVLQPQDTTLNLNSTNYSTDTTLYAYTWPDYHVANAIILKFDLSALPQGAVISDARLYLSQISSDSTSDTTYTVTANKLVGKNPTIGSTTGYTINGTTSWTPNSCCYNGVPLAQADISVPYDTEYLDKTTGFKSWVLTPMVQEWVTTPSTNFGVLLNSDATKAADRWRYFASMHYADATQRPQLRIKYTVSNNTGDTTPPQVSLTAPASGATVSGTVTVSANATDNVGVAGVQFKIDGANLGVEDTASPFTVSWPTGQVANGLHTLTAVARDAAGNTTTSAGVTVTVSNAIADTTPPTVSLTAPSAGSTVSGSITVSANASDNVGVVGVQFQIDGANLGTEDTSSPYSVTWNSTTASNGTHSLTAVARDAAGNRTTSAAVSVTVSNTVVTTTTGIASKYSKDVGIETDPSVLFVEKFDESSLSSLFTRWTDILNGSTMAFTTDVPPNAGSTHSLNIPWQGGGVLNGGHLYRIMNPVTDTLYIRYYIKYPTSGAYRHTGIWVGGYNPVSSWPNPQAGVKPAGNDRFSAAAEVNQQTGLFDTYDYWTGMHQSADGNYWGNVLLNNQSVKPTPGAWMCVEQMVKLNNPVSGAGGEQAIWLNGVKVGDLGPGFPTGTWNGGNFTQSASGAAFPGFQWRTDSNLNLNYIWLQNYSPDDPAGFSGNMLFAHVVAATSYIGCLAQ